MVIVDPNKPLPAHTKLNYHECYAKIVLEDLFASTFSNLLLKDKPDLQDIQTQIGIEVTIAETPKTKESEKLYSTLPYVREETRLKNIGRIGQCGATYEHGILYGPNGVDDFTLINGRINVKAKKLHKGEYKEFSEYHLFIFSSIWASESMLKDELSYLNQKRLVDCFQKIDIQLPKKLLYFDLTQNSYKVFSIDGDKQFQWASEARERCLAYNGGYNGA